MTYCKKCNGIVGDIGDPHKCPTAYTVHPGFSVPVNIRVGQKCDMCGSTAIDHTENQCNLNRKLTKVIGVK